MSVDSLIHELNVLALLDNQPHDYSQYDPILT